MTGMHSRSKLAVFKSELEAGRNSVRDLLRSTLQEILEEEMTEALGAAKGERTSDRLGYRSGYCKRHLTTHVGQVELRVPQDRNGASGTELFERYECSEKRPAGFAVANVSLFDSGRPLREGPRGRGCPRPGGPDCGRGRRGGPPSGSRRRACGGREPCELASVPGVFAGSRPVRRRPGCVGRPFRLDEGDPEAVRQRCCVHFLRNARARSDRRSGDGCLKELRWIYDRPSVDEARADLAAWLSKRQESQPKLCDRVEETIEETFAFLRLPRQHHLRMRSTNMLERLNEEIKRRTKVVRIFPDARSCLRLVRALCAEIHESWMEDGVRCPDMDLLQEQRRADLRKLAA